MVKYVYFILDDSEYEKIVKYKGNKKWKEYVKELVEIAEKCQDGKKQ